MGFEIRVRLYRVRSVVLLLFHKYLPFACTARTPLRYYEWTTSSSTPSRSRMVCPWLTEYGLVHSVLLYAYLLDVVAQ